MADWSTKTTLSKFSMPRMACACPALLWPGKIFQQGLAKISFIKEDLPEPETPVIQTNWPSGI